LDVIAAPGQLNRWASLFELSHRMTMQRAKIFAAVASLLLSCANLVAAASRTEPDLYRVKKIFLETQTNEDVNELLLTAFRPMHPALKEALLTYGFVVVDDRADADAVMYGGHTKEWVVLDGPQLDPPKHGFQFWVASSKYEFKWLTEFDLSTRTAEPELGRKATAKAARNLFDAWKQSAARAGIRVGDRLP
jgi:hypothetical protein